jgi:hypothetical protein
VPDYKSLKFLQIKLQSSDKRNRSYKSSCTHIHVDVDIAGQNVYIPKYGLYGPLSTIFILPGPCTYICTCTCKFNIKAFTQDGVARNIYYKLEVYRKITVGGT